MNFNVKYRRLGVKWQGYVVRVQLNEEDYISMGYIAANILVKMETNDEEGVFGADLGLSISRETLTQLADTVEQLHTGDKIEFDASI